MKLHFLDFQKIQTFFDSSNHYSQGFVGFNCQQEFLSKESFIYRDDLSNFTSRNWIDLRIYLNYLEISKVLKSNSIKRFYLLFFNIVFLHRFCKILEVKQHLIKILYTKDRCCIGLYRMILVNNFVWLFLFPHNFNCTFTFI